MTTLQRNPFAEFVSTPPPTAPSAQTPARPAGPGGGSNPFAEFVERDSLTPERRRQLEEARARAIVNTESDARIQAALEERRKSGYREVTGTDPGSMGPAPPLSAGQMFAKRASESFGGGILGQFLPPHVREQLLQGGGRMETGDESRLASVAGSLGSAVGQAPDIIAAMAPIGPASLIGFAAQSAGQHLQDTEGRTDLSVGQRAGGALWSGFSEAATERLGLSALTRGFARGLGFRKIVQSAFDAIGTNIAEEEINLISQAMGDVAAGIITPDQARQRIVAQAPMVAQDAAAMGVLFGGAGAAASGVSRLVSRQRSGEETQPRSESPSLPKSVTAAPAASSDGLESRQDGQPQDAVPPGTGDRNATTDERRPGLQAALSQTATAGIPGAQPQSASPDDTSVEDLAAKAEREARERIAQREASAGRSIVPASSGMVAPPLSQRGQRQNPQREAYIAQAMENLSRSSRTAQGVVDTSASAGKAEKMAVSDGAQAASAARSNFHGVIGQLFDERGRDFESPADVTAFVDGINQQINKGITKEGVLLRTDDSPKYPYAPAAELEQRRDDFAQRLLQRINDPNVDPVETAAWVHWRLNFTDHAYADGVGKTAEALADWVLMRAGLPLAKIASRDDLFAFAPREKPRSSVAWWAWKRHFYKLAGRPDPLPDAKTQFDTPEIVQARSQLGELTIQTQPDDPAGELSEDAAKQLYGGKVPEGLTRGQVRQRIREHLYATEGIRQDRKAFIVLGPPAAGKSTIADPIAAENSALVIDSDAAKELLPGFAGGLGAAAVHEESDAIKEDLLELATNAGDNIVLPIVGKTAVNVAVTMAELRRKGYEIHLRLVQVPIEIAAFRAAERFHTTGRFVDPKYVLSVAQKPRETYDLLKGKADTYEAHDTTKRGPERVTEAGIGAKLQTGPGAAAEAGRDQAQPERSGRGAGAADQRSAAGFEAEPAVAKRQLAERDAITGESATPKVAAPHLVSTVDEAKRLSGSAWLGIKNFDDLADGGKVFEVERDGVAMTGSLSPDGKTLYIAGFGNPDGSQKRHLGVAKVKAMATDLLALFPAADEVLYHRNGREVSIPRTNDADAGTSPPAAAPMPAKPANAGIRANLSPEKQAQLAELEAWMAKKLGTELRSGFDPEMFAKGAQMGALYVEAGARTFTKFTREMLDTFGDAIKPFLKLIYNAARDFPGADASGMDSYEQVQAADVESLSKEPTDAPVPHDRRADDDAGSSEGDGGEAPAAGAAGAGQPIAQERAGSAEGDAAGTGDRADADVSDRDGVDDQRGQSADAGNDDGRSGAQGAAEGAEQGAADGGVGDAGRRAGRGTKRTGRKRDRSGGAGSATADPGSREQAATGADPATVERLDAAGDAGPVAIDIPEADRNHRIGTDDALAPAGLKGKAKGNVAAIKLLRTLEAENRNPTPDEKKTLAQYVGWGALPAVFDQESAYRAERNKEHRENGAEYLVDDRADKWQSQWGTLYKQVKELLSDEQWRQARSSTLNAHYTSREVIEHGLWAAARRMGFRGGRVLENSAGIGHVMGLMPEDMAGKSNWTAVELDEVSAAILGKLYPQARTMHSGFENADLKNNTFDLIIGNVPFAASGPNDGRYPSMSLHNYFFARSIDLAKPGGLVVLISSDSTLDGPSTLREWAKDRVDFLGAVRMPNNAFKANAGTEVVTDIIILRKRSAERLATAEPWRDLRTIEKLPTREGTRDGTYDINEYFHAHPEMMLGKPSLKGTMYGSDDDFTLEPLPGAVLTEQLDKAIEAMPEPRLLSDSSATPPPAPPPSTDSDRPLVGGIPGTIGRHGTDVGRVLDDGTFEAEKDEDAARVLDDYLNLLGDLNKQRALELGDGSKKAMEANRKAMATRYRNFVKDHGTLDVNEDALGEDPRWGLVAALEIVETKYDEIRGKSGKVSYRARRVVEEAPILTSRQLFPPSEPATAGTIEDAAAISTFYRGKLDYEYIGKMRGISPEAAEAELLRAGVAYRNPESGLLETRADYLSGDVKTKLAQARTALANDPAYQANVESLTAVQPVDLPLAEISINAGARWIPPQVYADWINSDLLNNAGRVSIEPGEDSFAVHGFGAEMRPEMSNEWGVSNPETGAARNGIKIIGDLLNSKPSVVTYSVFDPETRRDKDVQDPVATTLANEKQNQLRDRFERWARMSQHQQLLADTFNEQVNRYVERQWEAPAFETYPGMAPGMNVQKHNRMAIARGIAGSYLNANGVGTGKTWVELVTAMEMRRLGLAKKPMIVVQNSTREQIVNTAKRIYPGAKILYATAKDFQAANRKRLLGKMATGDWDMVIMAQSQFNMLADDPGRVMAVLRRYEDELERLKVEAARRDGKASPRVKDLERALKGLRKNLQKLMDRKIDSGMPSFEELGVDALLVDEAHEYKKLPFITQMERVRGIDMGASQRAMSLWMKTEYIRERVGARRNVILLTGTPVTNTLPEVFTMLRFVRPDLLERVKLGSFDRFASMFFSAKQSVERDATGRFKNITRLAHFRNQVSMVRLWRDASMRVTAEMLGLPRPELKGDGPQTMVIDRSPEMGEYMDGLIKEYEAWEHLSGTEKREKSHVPLTINTRARKAAVDLRLVKGNGPPDASSKVERCIEELVKRWKEGADARTTQVVFCDLFNSNLSSPDEAADEDVDQESVAKEIETITGKGKGKKKAPKKRAPEADQFDVFVEIKKRLMAEGIPENEIAIASDAKNAAARERMFAKVNSGQIRIIMGTTQKLGVGVNIQERLAALHHLDVPWTPAWMEQREGRILRQGNMVKLAEIIRYTVERTFDAGAYGRLEFKARFINQVLAGDIKSELQMEEGQDTLSYAEAAALAQGDPRYQERAEMLNRSAVLSQALEGHKTSQERARMAADTARQRAGELEGRIAALDAVERKLPGDAAMKLNGEDIDAETLDKALEASIADLTNRILAGKQDSLAADGELVIAKRTFKLMLLVSRWGDKITAGIHWTAIPGVLGGEGKSGRGLLQSIRNGLARIDKDIEQLNANRLSALRDAQVNDGLAVQPFPQQDELDGVVAAYNRLNDELTALEREKAKAAEAKKSLIDKAIDVAQKLEDAALADLNAPQAPLGRSAGQAPLINWIADMGIIAAARAVKAGARTSKAINQVVKDTINDLKPHFIKHLKKVQTITRSILDKAQRDKTYDAAAFEAAVELVKKNPKAARLAYYGGIGEGVAKMKAQLPRIRLEIKRRHEAKTLKVSTIRRMLIAEIRKNLPPSLHGRFLAQMKNVKTARGLTKAIGMMNRLLAHNEGKAAWHEIRTIASEKRIGKKYTVDIRRDIRLLRGKAEAARQRMLSKDKTNPAKPRSWSMAELAGMAREIIQAKRDIQQLIADFEKAQTVRVGTQMLDAGQYRQSVMARMKRKSPIPSDKLAAFVRNAGGLKRFLRRQMTPDSIAMLLDGDYTAHGPTWQLVVKELWQGETARQGEMRRFLDDVNAASKGALLGDLAQLRIEIGGALGEMSQWFITDKPGVFVNGARTRMRQATASGFIETTIDPAKAPTIRLLGGEKLTVDQALDIFAKDPDTQLQEDKRAYTFADRPHAEEFLLTAADRTAIEDALPDHLKDFVREVKRLRDDRFRDRMFKAHLAIKGWEPDPVVDYYPRRINREQVLAQSELPTWRAVTDRHLEDAGFLKLRDEDAKAPMMIGSFIETVLRQADASAAIIHMAERVRHIESVMRHPDVKSVMESRFGGAMVERIEEMIRLGAGVDKRPLNLLDRAFMGYVRNVSKAKTMLNVRTWLRNMTGAITLMASMPPALVRDGMAKALDPGVGRRMFQYSDFAWARYQNNPHAIFSMQPDKALIDMGPFKASTAMTFDPAEMKQLATTALREIKGGNWKQGVKNLHKLVGDTLRISMLADSFALRVAWAGFEQAAKDRMPQATEAERMEWVAWEFEQVIRRTQNTHSVNDTSGLVALSRSSTWLAPVLALTGDNQKKFNLFLQALGTKDKRTIARTTMTLAAGAVAASAITGGFGYVVYELLAAMLGGDDEWERAAKQNKALERAAWAFLREWAGLSIGGSQLLEFVEAKVTGFAKGERLLSASSSVGMELIGGLWDIIDAYERWTATAEEKERMRISSGEMLGRGVERVALATLDALGVSVSPTYWLLSGARPKGSDDPRSAAGQLRKQAEREEAERRALAPLRR